MSNGSNNCAGSWTGSTVVWTTTTTGGQWYSIPVDTIVEPAENKKENKDGCNCKKCKEFYPYAEPNQDDGTLICYSCRHGY